MQRDHVVRRSKPGAPHNAVSQRLQMLWSIITTTSMPTEEGDEAALSQLTVCRRGSGAMRRHCR